MPIDGSPQRRPGGNAAVAGLARNGPQGDVGHAHLPALGTRLASAAAAQELLDRAAAADVGRLRDGDALSVPGLRAMSARERINALRFWLCDANVEPPSTARLNEALRQIFEARVDHLPAVVWGDYALRRYRQRVFLTDARPPRLEETRHWRVASGSQVDLGPQLGTLRWAAQRGGLDAQRLPDTVSVRRRSGGEALKPRGNA